jgi:hypothetical protein
VHAYDGSSGIRSSKQVIDSSKEDLKFMMRITSKVKIAAGLAAGALTLGAAGAYAATAKNTITVQNPAPFTLGTGSNQLTLIPLNGADKLTLPADGFKNAGACVSSFAKNKNYALAPEGTTNGSSIKLSKNYHGKLMSGLNAWCKTQVTSTAKTEKPETETPDAAESDSENDSDSTDSKSGKGQGHGHAYGHSKHANLD